jgi:type IV pilus assembly protein PilY1
MNISFRPRSKVVGFLTKLLYSSIAVCGLGIGSMPAQAASITVDPSPLIIQASLPPNITLMLDDSGSMDYDFMPDWDYLSDKSNDGARNSSVNGAYYNPAVFYTPPPKADGSFYSASPGLTTAYKDGFLDTTTTDITRFSSPRYASSDANQFPFYTKFTVTVTSNYNATPHYTYSCPAGYTSANTSQCKKTNNPNKNTIIDATITKTTYTCNNGDSINGTQCTNNAQIDKYFFTYTTGSSNTQHYVGASTTDCGTLSTANQAVCDGSAATQQNVANWFSYYRTRMMMAKSGLMSSFLNIDAKYRVGFGSIDGGGRGNSNYANLPSSQYSYSDSYSGGTNYIAQVQPFGDGTNSNDQKTAFWNWASKAKPSGGTPLRQALDAVGQYYEQGQPWKTMSSDPNPDGNANTELACRQSYTILTTDGFWNDSYSSAGDVDGVTGKKVTGPNNQSYTYTPALPYQDRSPTTSITTKNFSQTNWTSAQCTASYNGAQGASNLSYTPATTGRNAKPSKCTYNYTETTTSTTSYSNTLADVAMQYWQTDLRPAADNEVAPNTEDPAFWQHMTTFTLGLGFTPAGISPSGTTVDQVFSWANGGTSIPNFSWPKPASDNINNIADLAHAAVNGHGGFYSATSPDSFTNGLKDALKRTTSRTGTGASLAANSTQLQAGTVAYQANYITATWAGDLKAFSVDSTTGAIANTPIWTASAELPAPASRTIYTYNPDAKTYLAFALGSGNALPSLSSSQNSALSTLSGTATSEANMINYLRGDKSQEEDSAGPYRNRTAPPLGDIVDSQPVYVGAPDPNQFIGEAFTGSPSFAQYASDKLSRTGLIYVAANDGLLHAFNAGTGVEAFAYLPGAVITNGLTDLADPQYGGDLTHEYFNDGELTVGDVYFTSSSTWHTVLVGTTGRGKAKAVYALDVTNPDSIQFLWERSASDGLTNSNYIGQMTGKPVIAQTADGIWSVLMGNGYNSAAGAAALLQFNIADGTLNVHATTDATGLAAPAVWMDPAGNGISTIAYSGDTDGNVWSFALNTTTSTTTSAGTTITITPTPNSSGVKLFTAKDASNNAQPITAGMLAGKDSQSGNVWVFFGTGKYLASTDLIDVSTQSWYGLVVQSASTSNPAVGAATTMDRSALAQRAITGEAAATSTSLALRTVTTAAVADSMTGKSGWYIDLLSPTGTGGSDVQQGERMVTPNQFQGNLLLGTTRIPQAVDACNPSGRGWIMAIDPFTGTNPASSFFDANGDGVINSSDTINGVPAAGVGFSSLPNNPIFVGSTMLTSFDNGTTSSLSTSSSTGNMTRVSWRELISQ